MEKTVKIDGKNVRLKSSAAIPRMYRNVFGKDIFKDISANDTLMNQVNQLTEYLNNPDIGFGKRRN